MLGTVSLQTLFLIQAALEGCQGAKKSVCSETARQQPRDTSTTTNNRLLTPEYTYHLLKWIGVLHIANEILKGRHNGKSEIALKKYEAEIEIKREEIEIK